MLLKNKHVAIIGAGPAGLTLARLLQQKGVAVKVYERDIDPQARQQGSSLDIHQDTGLKAIAAAGLLDEFKLKYRRGGDRMVIVDNKMTVLVDEPVDDQSGDFDDPEFKPEIDRGVMRDMLVASLESDTIVWGAKFTEMNPSGAGLELQFQNGTTAYADLVVAGDGGRSKVREYVTDIRTVYSGKVGLEGYVNDAAVNAPRLWKLINGRNLVALGPGKTMILPTKGGGAINYIIPVAVSENWPADTNVDLSSGASLRAWFKKEFADWSADWDELFPDTGLKVAARPWYFYPPDQIWASQPNIVLMGDAAHVMPPDGKGGNLALADALELSEVLCSDRFSSIEEAIAAFERAMRERAVTAHEQMMGLLTKLNAEDNVQFFLGLYEEGM